MKPTQTVILDAMQSNDATAQSNDASQSNDATEQSNDATVQSNDTSRPMMFSYECVKNMSMLERELTFRECVKFINSAINVLRPRIDNCTINFSNLDELLEAEETFEEFCKDVYNFARVHSDIDVLVVFKEIRATEYEEIVKLANNWFAAHEFEIVYQYSLVKLIQFNACIIDNIKKIIYNPDIYMETVNANSKLYKDLALIQVLIEYHNLLDGYGADEHTTSELFNRVIKSVCAYVLK